MNFLLFTTPTCPNCPRVKEYMKTTGLVGDFIDAATKEGLDKAREFKVTSVPTVIFLKDKNEVARVNSKEAAEKFISENK
ncbi:hypothetical protein JXM83_02795 [Candidatus Woesearchaeota archaeon]|nr:hypothetical protein [Candidatus Woesearchaeota archaeon]